APPYTPSRHALHAECCWFASLLDPEAEIRAVSSDALSWPVIRPLTVILQQPKVQPDVAVVGCRRKLQRSHHSATCPVLLLDRWVLALTVVHGSVKIDVVVRAMSRQSMTKHRRTVQSTKSSALSASATVLTNSGNCEPVYRMPAVARRIPEGNFCARE